MIPGALRRCAYAATRCGAVRGTEIAYGAANAGQGRVSGQEEEGKEGGRERGREGEREGGRRQSTWASAAMRGGEQRGKSTRALLEAAGRRCVLR
eukprot:1448479-Rhodomonas_salina.1